MVKAVYVKIISIKLSVFFMLIYKLKVLYDYATVESDYQSVIP